MARLVFSFTQFFSFLNMITIFNHYNSTHKATNMTTSSVLGGKCSPSPPVQWTSI